MQGESEASVSEETDVLAAIRQGDAAMVQELLQQASLQQVVDERTGRSPLHVAAGAGQAEVLRLLVDADYCPVDSRDREGETPLLAAVFKGHEECVRVLLDSGADPNVFNRNETTPLWRAVEKGHWKLAQYLIAHGARISPMYVNGWVMFAHKLTTVAQWELLSAFFHHVDTAEIGDEHGLLTAAQCGMQQQVEALLGQGVDVNWQASDGCSALHLAAQYGQVECVQLLLQGGADANLTTDTGQLPLHLAAQAGHSRCVELLCPATCKNTVNKCPESPFHSAVANHHAECIKLLAASGFSPNTLPVDGQGKPGNSALHGAVVRKDRDCIEELLKCGADANLDHPSVLCEAIKQRDVELMRLLIQHGADVNYWYTPHKSVVQSTLLFILQQPNQVRGLADPQFSRWSRQDMLKLLLDTGLQADCCFQCDCDESTTIIPQHKTGKRRMYFCEHARVFRVKIAPVVRLLLEYCREVSLCTRLTLVLEDKCEWDRIITMIGRMRSLPHLCRLSVRTAVGSRRLAQENWAENLPVPQKVQNFVQFTNRIRGIGLSRAEQPM